MKINFLSASHKHKSTMGLQWKVRQHFTTLKLVYCFSSDLIARVKSENCWRQIKLLFSYAQCQRWNLFAFYSLKKLRLTWTQNWWKYWPQSYFERMLSSSLILIFWKRENFFRRFLHSFRKIVSLVSDALLIQTSN